MLVAPQALKSVLPVTDSFSNKEMRTFSRIRAHQSTSKRINTSLWRRKTKPASVTYFAVLATNKTCGTFRDKFLSFLCCGASCFKKYVSSRCRKEPVSYFNPYSRIFPGILAGQRAQRLISLPPVIASSISFMVFFDDTSRRSSATALLVTRLFSSLRRSKSATTYPSIFCPLTGSAEMSPLDFTATVQ